MKLQGLIGSQEVLILVNSCISSTFINSATVQKLNFHLVEATEVQVTVANGNKLVSNTTVLDLTWWVQGHAFTTKARVLDLQYYDIVLGMD
jgi:hypothetical protein